jgi:hypothetical protein
MTSKKILAFPKGLLSIIYYIRNFDQRFFIVPGAGLLMRAGNALFEAKNKTIIPYTRTGKKMPVAVP